MIKNFIPGMKLVTSRVCDIPGRYGARRGEVNALCACAADEGCEAPWLSS